MSAALAIYPTTGFNESKILSCTIELDRTFQCNLHHFQQFSCNQNLTFCALWNCVEHLNRFPLLSCLLLTHMLVFCVYVLYAQIWRPSISLEPMNFLQRRSRYSFNQIFQQVNMGHEFAHLLVLQDYLYIYISWFWKLFHKSVLFFLLPLCNSLCSFLCQWIIQTCPHFHSLLPSCMYRHGMCLQPCHPELFFALPIVSMPAPTSARSLSRAHTLASVPTAPPEPSYRHIYRCQTALDWSLRPPTVSLAAKHVCELKGKRKPHSMFAPKHISAPSCRTKAH